MPTYEYTCDSCGYEFEREQRITEDPIKRCPNCGKMKARRMIGGGGFILKGGGWESDLYSGPSNRSKSEKGSAKSDGGGSASSDSESKSTKADSKPSTSSKSDS
ncbi:MAG: zinc ribbon domain-containing protein [Myxococcota bacterium]